MHHAIYQYRDMQQKQGRRRKWGGKDKNNIKNNSRVLVKRDKDKLFSQQERQLILSIKGPMNKQARPLMKKLTITHLNILSMN